MFDIAAAKQRLDIEKGKSEIQERPRAIPAIPAIPEGRAGVYAPKNSTNSTNSTPPPFENENGKAGLEPLDDLLNAPFKPHTVRCIDCQHFTRVEHPNLGHCGASVKESPAGMWDTSQRGCDKHRGMQ